MSNVKTGITVRDSLKSLFSTVCHEGNVRLIKVQLSDGACAVGCFLQLDSETLMDVCSKPAVSSWEHDFSLVPPELEDRNPCFILYRTDDKSGDRYLWYMLCHVPDTAPVRLKMLYAGTRHSFKNELGAHLFIDEVHGTERKEFSPEGFQEYKRHVASEAPLTAEEVLKKEERLAGLAECSGGSSVAYAHGVSFPIDEGVNSAFSDLKAGRVNYIQLMIDLDAEVIKVAESTSLSPAEVGSHVPTADCAFHYYNWEHVHQGATLSSLVFAFSCPDGSGGTKGAPVKQRMLYASSKANAMGIPVSNGLEVACKLEVACAQDFTEAEYSVVIHPPQEEEKKGFKKPAAPRGRRMVGK